MKQREPFHYVLRLFVTGHSALSNSAIVNIRKICEENLAGRYKLEIVDVSEHPDIAVAEQIVAAPTLIKQLPEPLRRFIGDMSHTDRILAGLDVRKEND
jgi:circadian clock protein KaiB